MWWTMDYAAAEAAAIVTATVTVDNNNWDMPDVAVQLYKMTLEEDEEEEDNDREIIDMEQCANCGNIWDGYAQCNCHGLPEFNVHGNVVEEDNAMEEDNAEEDNLERGPDSGCESEQVGGE